MGVRSKLTFFGLVALMLSVWGMAAAQPGSEAGATEQQPSLALPPLSPQQMAQEAAELLPQMTQGMTAVRNKLEEARAARDVVKVLCLKDKLMQLEVVIRSAADRYSAFRVALQRGDVEGARHEFAVLQVLRDRARELVAEADQCIGEETGLLGESQVTVDIDPMPEPAVYPQEPSSISIPPTVSSPTQ
jgi:hypothetical protein